MKRAFTLIEVNLAMLIMAGGILSLVGLYSLGFRESAQSAEDVEGAAVADYIISEATKALSLDTIQWSQFKNVVGGTGASLPEKGWRDYLDQVNDELVCKNDPRQKARGILSGLGIGNYSPQTGNIPNDYYWGIVVTQEENSGVVTIAVRVAKEMKTLIAQPLYVSKVRVRGKR